MKKFEFDIAWDLTKIILCFASAFYMMFNTDATVEYLIKTFLG